MANPTALRTGLANRLKIIKGMGTVYPRWPDAIMPPCAIIRRGEMEPEQTFGTSGPCKWLFEVYLFTSLAGGYGNAQDNLDPFLATSSTGGLYGVIDGDRTLGGVAITTFVRGIREDDQYDLGGGDIAVAGAVADIEVWAS